MELAGDYRAEVEHLHGLAKDVTDPETLMAIRDLIDELETRARELENRTSIKH